MFYITENGELKEWADYKFSDSCNEYPSITMEEYNAEPYKLVLVDGNLEPNPNYEKEKADKERERISNLRCTKRVLALILQELGIPYSQLKALIDSNERAQLEWDLCVELERSNPLLDLVGAELGLSSVDIDNIFRYANGEIPTIKREVTNE